MIENKDAIIIFSTCPDKNSAEKIAKELVENELAACVNMIEGLTSIYRWQGQICRDQELLLIIKTTSSKLNELETKIKALHPYQLPEIIALPINMGSKEYLNWLKSQGK
jgi:periplasmic divalent cation tolerance protein